MPTMLPYEAILTKTQNRDIYVIVNRLKMTFLNKNNDVCYDIYVIVLCSICIVAGRYSVLCKRLRTTV